MDSLSRSRIRLTRISWQKPSPSAMNCSGDDEPSKSICLGGTSSSATVAACAVCVMRGAYATETTKATQHARRSSESERLLDQVVRLSPPSLRQPEDSAASHAIDCHFGVVERTREREAVGESSVELCDTDVPRCGRFVVQQKITHRVDEELPLEGDHLSEVG